MPRPGGRFAFTAWAAPEQSVGFGILLRTIQTQFMFSRLDTGAVRKRRKKCKARNKNERQDKPLPRLAVSCQGPYPGEFAGDGLRRIARTFEAQESGLLHSIEVTVAGVAGAGDYSLQLVVVRDGAPSASPLDGLAVALVPDSGVADDPFPLIGRFSGPPLTAGTEYAVVVSRPRSGVTSSRL